MSKPGNDDFVRTFARGLQVIQVMGHPQARQNIAQISEAAQLPRTVVRRLLMTLIELGFVDTEESSYWLTPSVLRLGMAYLHTVPFWRQSQAALEELGTKLGQSCAIAVLDQEDIVYIQRFHTKGILALNPGIGSRLPAYSVSMGRVLLAGRPEARLTDYMGRVEMKKLTSRTVTDKEELLNILAAVRAKGYAWGDREYDEAICGLAVPVRDQDGHVIAALNVSLLAGEYTERDAVSTFLPLLKLTASQLQSLT